MRRFHFEFIGRKWLWFAISGTIIGLGIIAILLGGLKFGIEFQGGTLLDIKFAKTVPSVAEMRKTVTPFKMEDSVIQPKEGNEMLVRSHRLSNAETTQVQAAIKKAFAVKAINTTTVGPQWGQQVTSGAIKALIFSLLVLLAYISLRFEYKMAVAAIVALFHDILVVIGVYALVGLSYNVLSGAGLTFFPREVTPNTVAAILTILGYSLYDTIVVFHRIQENTPLIGKRSYSVMANDSINQVLIRSINTSLTALIPVTVLLIFGGTTLKDFAFALLVGLVSGAYSSIFIASPILAMWKEIEPRYRVARERFGTAAPRPTEEVPVTPGMQAEREATIAEESLGAPRTPAPRPAAKKKKPKKKRR